MHAAIAGEPHPAADNILPSSQMTADERLAVYQRAYLARLVECLRAEFPMLCRALGQELFDAFATGYLVQHPSTSYTLADLGQKLPDYLRSTHPRDETCAWYEALAELAELEWVTNEVFNGSGVEQDPAIDVAMFAPETWNSLRVTLAPCVRLLELDYPIHDYYQRLHSNSDTTPPMAETTFLVVSRRDYTVRHRAVGKLEFKLLRSLQCGSSIEQSIAAVIDTTTSDVDEQVAQFHTAFSLFAAERFVRVTNGPSD